MLQAALSDWDVSLEWEDEDGGATTMLTENALQPEDRTDMIMGYHGSLGKFYQ